MKLVKAAIVLAIVLGMAALPAMAKQEGKAVGKVVSKAVDKNAGKADTKADAGDKLTNEIVDAVTRPLTGAESKGSGASSMPPGLEKKDKTPPGWSKGKKTGWNKDEPKCHQDSVIDKVVKAITGK